MRMPALLRQQSGSSSANVERAICGSRSVVAGLIEDAKRKAGLWHFLGEAENRLGRYEALVISRENPNLLYAGTAGAGVLCGYPRAGFSRLLLLMMQRRSEVTL
jgi:hypothetical protein